MDLLKLRDAFLASDYPMGAGDAGEADDLEVLDGINILEDMPDARRVVLDILAERIRTTSLSHCTPDDDDAQTGGEFATAAGCYIAQAQGLAVARAGEDIWPWSGAWPKPRRRRDMLIKAAALLVAEVQRVDRELDNEMEMENGG